MKPEYNHAGFLGLPSSQNMTYRINHTYGMALHVSTYPYQKAQNETRINCNK